MGQATDWMPLYELADVRLAQSGRCGGGMIK